MHEHWKDDPEEHDFPAASDYLTLVMTEAEASATVAALKASVTTHRKAKDLLRASALPTLPPSNVHVAKDLDKVAKGIELSPVLLVRGQAEVGALLVIADGYHRICASYHLDENADVSCRIVDGPRPA